MDNFFIHFVLCNITIGLFVLILLCMKRIFKHCLTPRMQFNLWIPFTISLFVPFLPVSFSTLSTKMQDRSTLLHILATQSIPQILRNIHPHPQIKSMITQSPCVHSFQSIFLPFFV